MTMNEFEQLAETWGGDLARWPEAVRAEAAAFARSPQAQAILDDARRLDRQIANMAPDISSGRVDRAVYGVVSAIAARERLASVTSRSWFRWLVPATGCACAALIGISLAISHPVELVRRPSDAGTILTLLLDSTEQD